MVTVVTLVILIALHFIAILCLSFTNEPLSVTELTPSILRLSLSLCSPGKKTSVMLSAVQLDKLA